MAGYAFLPGEAFGVAFRRMFKRQLRAAARALATDENPAVAVHRARRCLKRSRALIALLEPTVARKRWSKAAKALKRAGQDLAGARDEQAKLDALERLTLQSPRAINAPTVRLIRKVIEARRLKRERGVAKKLESDLAIDLSQIGRHFRRKRLEQFDEDALLAGIVHTYRRGRRAMQAAMASGRDEDFHAWRREVQTHWRHMQLIDACAPSEARARAEMAKTLSGVLGKDHDLWLLLAELVDRALPLGEPARQRLRRAILAAQAELREQANAIGAQLYAEKPKALQRRIEAAWDKPMLQAAVPAKRGAVVARRLRATTLAAV